MEFFKNETMEQPSSSHNILCCCCLELISNKSIWSEHLWMGQTEVYGQMLMDCFSINWPRRASSNDQICEVCITHLRNAMHFKQKVLQGQQYMEQQIMSVAEHTTKVEPVTKDEQESNVENNLADIDKKIYEVEQYDDGKNNEGEQHFVGEQYDEIEQQDEIEQNNKIKLKNVLKQKHKVSKGVKKKSTCRKKQKTVDLIPLNYMKPRQNVCLILENSTILPFRSSKGYFNCFHCNKQYVIFSDLKQHMQESHENMDLKSILKSITRPCQRLRADVSEINCKICKTKLESLEKLVSHLSTEHNIQFNLDDPRKPENSILGYDLSDGKFKCCQCKKEFLFFKTLTEHMNEHSADYVCDVCGRAFLLPERLRAHIRKHEEPVSLQCDDCGKVCSSRYLLKNHVRYAHKQQAYGCSICDQFFTTGKDRRKHLEEVHNRAILNLTCKLCSKTFAWPSSLNNHIKVEHMKVAKEAKHACSVCDMRFKNRYDVSIHMIVHSGEKNHECEVCHKKYARIKTLREHLKIHYNDKRWSCGVCSQAFVQKCSVKNHIRVHHADLSVEDNIVYKKREGK